MANTYFKIDNGLLVNGDSLLQANAVVNAYARVANNLTVDGDLSVAGNIAFSNVTLSGKMVPIANGIALGNTTRTFDIWSGNLNFSNSIVIANTTPINIKAGSGIIANTTGIFVDLTAAGIGILPITSGGTGGSSRTAGLNNLLPAQSGVINGYVLKTDGTDALWASATSGYTGSRGFTGSASTVIGYTGSPGAVGFTGSAGYWGSKGDTGTGTQGYWGSKGDSGSVGFTGSMGYWGSKGDPGSGSTGYWGSKGDPGNVGFTGSVGYWGSKGDPGTGTQGYWGSKGDSGSVGFTGSVGYWGSKGDTGTFTGSYTGNMAITGAITATGDITAFFSDDRLKTKFGNIESALDKLLALSGFIFEPNELAQSLGYEKKREVGVSAQEVKAVLPEAIASAPIDSKYMAVKYERLIPLIIEAIKELSDMVKKLEDNSNAI